MKTLAIFLMAGAIGLAVAGHCWCYHEIVLRWAGLILSWEVLGFVLAMAVIVMFGESMNRLIDRIRAGKFGGVHFEASQSQQSIPFEVEPIAESQPDPSHVSGSSGNIQSDLERENAQLKDYLKFERAFTVIFGTQMGLLDYLVGKGLEGDTVNNLRPYYEEYLRLSGNTHVLMKDYTSFLLGMGFIEAVDDEQEPALRITLHGKAFIEYITDTYAVRSRFRLW